MEMRLNFYYDVINFKCKLWLEARLVSFKNSTLLYYYYIEGLEPEVTKSNFGENEFSIQNTATGFTHLMYKFHCHMWSITYFFISRRMLCRVSIFVRARADVCGVFRTPKLLAINDVTMHWRYYQWRLFIQSRSFHKQTRSRKPVKSRISAELMDFLRAAVAHECQQKMMAKWKG